MNRPPSPVAPDAQDRERVNRLVLQPLHRLSLRLGEIDDLFPHPENSEPGLMARLQVLGLFYFPLHHQAAKQALPVCWSWVKEQILKVSSDDEGYAFLRAGLKERVIGPAAVPFRETEDPKTAGLPARPDFAKIRLPGGYSFTTGGGQDGHFDPKYDLNSKAELYDVEEAFRADNPVLGKLPIVAKVERWDDRGSEWKPAFDVEVHFEVVPADDATPPEYDRPVLRQGYAEGVIAAEKHQEDSIDPQGRNCHVDFGGKRGGGALFATGVTRGFNEAHANRPLSHRPYPPAETNLERPRSVVARTNDDGEAGVVFLPSRMGGDRYRLSASVLSGTGAVGVETGVLVVWRNVRISRHLRKDPAKSVLPELVKEAHSYGIQDEEAYLAATDAGDGLPDLDVEKLRKKFAEAYCEIEFDEEPRALEEKDYAEGFDRIKKDSKESLLLRIPLLDFDKLLHPVAVAAQAGSIVPVPMLPPEAYNASFPDPSDKRRFRTVEPSDLGFMDAWKTSTMAPSFLRALSKDGFLPGLTIFQGALGCTWEILGLMGKETGAAYAHRGFLVWKGKEFYRKRDFTTIVAHEIGHCLFREHAQGAPGENPEEHDAENVCLMSYRPERETFCAKCLLALRGWKIRDSVPLVGGELRIRLAIDPAEASSFDDRFVLASEDGSYEESRTVKDDRIPGDRFVDLHYTGMDKTKRFTMTVRRSEEAPPEMLFQDVSYSELAALSPRAEP